MSHRADSVIGLNTTGINMHCLQGRFCGCCCCCCCCCSPIGIPVVTSKVGYGYRHVFLHLSLLTFSHCSLCPVSHFSCCSPLPFHCCQTSLNTALPSHSLSSSPPFHSVFWASAPFTNLSSPILSCDRLISTYSSPISSIS